MPNSAAGSWISISGRPDERDVQEADRLVSESSARVVVMRGRPMAGWLRIDAEDVQGDDRLAPWVARGVAFARSLPAK